MRDAFRLALLALFLATVATAEESPRVEPLILPESAVERALPPPMRLAESLSLEPPLALRSAREGAVDQIEAMRVRNASGVRPVQNGFSRPLPAPARVRLDAEVASLAAFQRYAGGFVAESPGGQLVWGTAARAAGAHRLRLHLTDVRLPAGTRMWVWGLGQEPRSFGLELLDPDGGLWTPSVGGEDIYLEVALPRSASSGGKAFGFEIRELGEIVRLGTDGAPAPAGPLPEPHTSCIQDGSCFNSSALDVIDVYRKAVAQLEYARDGGFFVCSGGLLNDSDTTTAIPYLLTANHCFADQAGASSLEAYWDYRTSACNGNRPDMDSLPRSQGATLLASAADTDFTLVRLNAIPGGRVLLGWSAQTVANGTLLHRLSHPAPDGDVHPQSYSRSRVNTAVGACADIPRPRFLYSKAEVGGTFGGSSGSPVVLQGGIVVGQLLGACGPNAEDGCDDGNAEVDGAFAATYPRISQYLNPPVSTGPCVPGPKTLCVDRQAGDRRFKVEVSYQTSQGGGLSGQGNAIPLSSLGITRGGLFWFFGADNPEMMIKVLDGCGLNQKFWVFYAAGTNVGLTTTVTDTVTGQHATYTNPDRTSAAPVQDLAALPCN